MARQTIPKILKVAVQMSWEWILLTWTNIASEDEFKGHNIFTFLEMNILKIWIYIIYVRQQAENSQIHIFCQNGKYYKYQKIL